MQLPGRHQRLISDGVAGAPHLLEPDKVPGRTAELHETIFTRRAACYAIAPSLRAPPFLGSSPTLHHWPGPAAEGRGGDDPPVGQGPALDLPVPQPGVGRVDQFVAEGLASGPSPRYSPAGTGCGTVPRSEERRVGKGGRTRGERDDLKRTS